MDKKDKLSFWLWISSSPGFRRLQITANRSAYAGGKESARDRVLTEAEIKQAWSALDGMREGDQAHRKYRMLSAATLKLRLLTAQRGEEAMGMQWGERRQTESAAVMFFQELATVV